MTLEECFDYIQGNSGYISGEAVESCVTRTLVKKIFDEFEQQNTALQARITELEAPKTCDGYIYLKKNWADNYKCYHPKYNECERLYITNRPDYYEPKESL